MIAALRRALVLAIYAIVWPRPLLRAAVGRYLPRGIKRRVFARAVLMEPVIRVAVEVATDPATNDRRAVWMLANAWWWRGWMGAVKRRGGERLL